MERDEELGSISKKQRTGDISIPEGKGSSEIVQTASSQTVTKFAEDVVYKLYFKGLVKYKKAETEGGKKTATGGFGIIICDHTDKLMFQLKEKVNDPDINGNGVEVTALVRGLKESFDLGIRRVAINTDAYQVHQFITGKWKKPKHEKLVQLMEQVRSLREKFAFSEVIRVPENEIAPAYKLAKETITPQRSRTKSKCLGTIYFYDIAEDGDYDDYNPGNGCDCCYDVDDRGGYVDYVDYYSL